MSPEVKGKTPLPQKPFHARIVGKGPVEDTFFRFSITLDNGWQVWFFLLDPKEFDLLGTGDQVEVERENYQTVEYVYENGEHSQKRKTNPFNDFNRVTISRNGQDILARSLPDASFKPPEE